MSPPRTTMNKPAEMACLLNELRRVSSSSQDVSKSGFWRVIRGHLRNMRPSRT